MKNSKNSAEQRYYTFVSWANRENPQTRMKVQGHSSIARAKKVIQSLMHLTDKFKVSIQMDADRQIGRKILDLRDQKVRAGHMILEEITLKPEAVTQVEAEAGANFKTDLSIACSMREIMIICHT
jgi:hypothetical protein